MGRAGRRFLGAARCLLVPSLVPETSSLVAMEALACGTSVIAFRVGALPEIIDHGRTGFIVEDERGMAEAVPLAARLSIEECREAARRRFSARRMVEHYIAAYVRLAQRAREPRRVCHAAPSGLEPEPKSAVWRVRYS